MADIKFLAGLDIDGNIDLNKGQLQAAVIHPLASNPSSPSVGQLYYNTGDDELKVYTSGGWIAVGADTDNYVDDGSYNASTGIITLERTGSLADINITGLLQLGTTSTTALAGNTRTINSTEIGKLGNITVTQAVDLDTMEEDVSTNNDKNSYPTADATKVGFITITGAVDLDTIDSDVSNNNNKTSFPGFGTTAGKALEGDTVIPAAANNGTLTIQGGGIVSVSPTNTFGANQSSNATITITATEADTLATVTARGATTSTALTLGQVDMLGDLDMNSGKIVSLADPTTAQGAATKNYVDNAVTGQLIYQGGYNASAAPPTGSSILKGFTYTVTTAGDGNGFFTTELEIGDLIIAESDNPTTEADWTEVNKNVDLATTSTVGVASFSSSNFAVSSAGEVTVKNNGIALGTETTGNYVASVSGSTNVTVSGGTGEGSTPSISVPNSNIDVRITNRQYAGLIGGSTSITIPASTHGLGSDSSQFMIQLVEVSSGETVHAEVTRGASGAVTIAFTTAPSANAIRVLINKIG